MARVIYFPRKSAHSEPQQASGRFDVMRRAFKVVGGWLSAFRQVRQSQRRSVRAFTDAAEQGGKFHVR